MHKIVFSKSGKQVVLLYVSTMLSVFLGVLSSVINTRFLDTVDYGDVRYVQNIINFIASLLLFGYFLSGSRLLALSKEEDYSRRIRGAMIVILGIACSFLILSCLVCYFVHKETNPLISHLFLIAIPVSMSPLLANYLGATAQGDNHIGRLSASKFIPSVIYVVVAYLLYTHTGATSKKMIILQQGVDVVILLFIILSTHPSFKDLKPIFKKLNMENKDYGLQLYLGSIVMVATNYIAGITISLVNQDNSEVGFYTLALSVTAPLATLPGIIGTTFFKRFASEDKIPSRVLKYSLILTILSFVGFVLIIKPVVTFIYTERYAPVGDYAIWLAFGFSVHGLGDMINRYLGSHGQGRSIRNSSIFNGLFKLFGYTFLVYLFNTKGAILTNIICSTIYAGCLYYYYKKFITKGSLKEQIHETL